MGSVNIEVRLHDGRVVAIEANAGQPLVEVILDHGLPGIDALCGGNCSCGTCVCYPEEGPVGMIDAPRQDELALLDASPVAGGARRLACQIRLDTALDGLVVRLPPNQGG